MVVTRCLVFSIAGRSVAVRMSLVVLGPCTGGDGRLGCLVVWHHLCSHRPSLGLQVNVGGGVSSVPEKERCLLLQQS